MLPNSDIFVSNIFEQIQNADNLNDLCGLMRNIRLEKNLQSQLLAGLKNHVALMQSRIESNPQTRRSFTVQNFGLRFIPQDVFVLLLRFLGMRDLLRSCAVNRQFQKTITDPQNKCFVSPVLELGELYIVDGIQLCLFKGDNAFEMGMLFDEDGPIVLETYQKRPIEFFKKISNQSDLQVHLYTKTKTANVINAITRSASHIHLTHDSEGWLPDRLMDGPFSCGTLSGVCHDEELNVIEPQCFPALKVIRFEHLYGVRPSESKPDWPESYRRQITEFGPIEMMRDDTVDSLVDWIKHFPRLEIVHIDVFDECLGDDMVFGCQCGDHLVSKFDFPVNKILFTYRCTASQPGTNRQQQFTSKFRATLQDHFVISDETEFQVTECFQ